MFAQLEIGSLVRGRCNGRFAKVQPVIVNGQTIGSLGEHKGAWRFECLPGQTRFDARSFDSRDDVCDYLFDRYTSEPEAGPFSLLFWREFNRLFDRLIDAKYRQTDDYLMRANAPDYHSWLDSLPVQESA